MGKSSITSEQIELIIQLYNQNWSLAKIAEQFDVSRSTITRCLKKQNITLRTRTTKHITNIDIFEKIDNTEKAYWLGFFAADGINYRREHNGTIGLNISIKDENHLYKFKDFCNSDAEITHITTSDGFSNNTIMSRLYIYSSKMSDDLTDKGVPPKKSLILQPPNIDKQYYLAYICGYFDGDGSICKTNQYNNYSLSIQGTKEILEWINSILHISNKLEKRNDDGKNSYYIRCGGTNKPYQVLYQLYNSCNTHLERKYEIYKNLETVVLSRNVK